MGVSRGDPLRSAYSRGRQALRDETRSLLAETAVEPRSVAGTTLIDGVAPGGALVPTPPEVLRRQGLGAQCSGASRLLT